MCIEPPLPCTLPEMRPEKSFSFPIFFFKIVLFFKFFYSFNIYNKEFLVFEFLVPVSSARTSVTVDPSR